MLYKRGRIWWISIAIGRKRPIRETAGTTDKVAAQEYHDRRAAELWRQHRLGERPRTTFEAAAADWLTTHVVHKRSAETDRTRLRVLLPFVPAGPLDQITTSQMTTIRDRIRAKRRLSAAGANRYLAVLSAILHHAHRREWIAAVPHVPMLPEPKRAPPIAGPAVLGEIIDALPEHLRGMAIFALATGMRQANVRGLRWDQIDLAERIARVPPSAAKAGETIVVPLSDDAMIVLRARLGQHPVYVFTYRGKPIRGGLTNSAWIRAKSAAGAPNLRWHDLRHIWATIAASAGIPEAVRQAWGGWKTAGMAARYTHLAGAALTPWANAIRLPQSYHTTKGAELTETDDLPGVADGIRTHDNWNHKPAPVVSFPNKSNACESTSKPKTGKKRA